MTLQSCRSNRLAQRGRIEQDLIGTGMAAVDRPSEIDGLHAVDSWQLQ